MIRRYLLLAVTVSFCLMLSQQEAVADSILDIPKRTVFQLQRELEIPANRDFALLGNNQIDEAFNGIGQVLNDQGGRVPGQYGSAPMSTGSGYLTFNTYYNGLFESFEETYDKCIERHRQYTVIPGTPAGNATIIQQGSGNIAVINQAPGTPSQVFSSIGENYCTPPNHTIAALVIDRRAADGGGFFAEGYEFKVRKVKFRRKGFYNVIKIYFDHEVLEGIVIVTTNNPETIPISALETRESSSGKGFWSSVGSALVDMINIGGGYFQIILPSKRYYD